MQSEYPICPSISGVCDSLSTILLEYRSTINDLNQIFSNKKPAFVFHEKEFHIELHLQKLLQKMSESNFQLFDQQINGQGSIALVTITPLVPVGVFAINRLRATTCMSCTFLWQKRFWRISRHQKHVQNQQPLLSYVHDFSMTSYL